MDTSPLLNLGFSKRNGSPIYVQIADAIRQGIIAGRFTPGLQLPSSRNLAVEVGVSRTSVISAYDQLKMEGYLVSRRGSGIRVSPLGNLDLIESNDKAIRSQWLNSRNKTSGNPTHPSLADIRLFPHRQWAKCIAKVARSSPLALIESKDNFGDMEFRESIAKYLMDWRGVDASPEQILVTAGSIDALELCVRTLLPKKGAIGLEDPGYLPLRNYVNQLGLTATWMTVDSDGAKPPKNKNTLVAIVTPSHQFPLGGTMSPARRMEFIDWSQASVGWIIEDDYDSEFRYAGKPIPALAGLDHLRRTIYIGSFAKIFTSGLRLGFLVIPATITNQFREALQKFPTKASISMQRPLSEFMNNGEFYRHIRRVRRVYAERRSFLVECLNKELGDLVSFENYQAGMQLAIMLPDALDDKIVSAAANERGANVLPLSSHYQTTKSKQGLLIGFCAYRPNEIEKSVSAIKSVINNLL